MSRLTKIKNVRGKTLFLGYMEKSVLTERDKNREEIFSLAEELKSSIALNFLSLYIIEF